MGTPPAAELGVCEGAPLEVQAAAIAPAGMAAKSIRLISTSRSFEFPPRWRKADKRGLKEERKTLIVVLSRP